MKTRLAFALLSSLSLAACGTHTLTTAEQQTAELGARDFFDKLGGKFVSCSGLDSNKDSYVTCTGTDKADKTTEVVCSYEATARGCKMKT